MKWNGSEKEFCCRSCETVYSKYVKNDAMKEHWHKYHDPAVERSYPSPDVRKPSLMSDWHGELSDVYPGHFIR